MILYAIPTPLGGPVAQALTPSALQTVASLKDFAVENAKSARAFLGEIGMQVRDLLFVEDLVRAFRLAQTKMDAVSGHAFNIGGGPTRAVSLLEVLELIEDLVGRAPDVHHEDWRTGDQRYYVSDTRKFQSATGWAPQVGVREGVTRLLGWLAELLEGRPSRRTMPREPLALETYAG